MTDNRIPPVPPAGGVRELRLARVCYGGVSLAIYMHRVTKEIHKLVRASEALHHHPEAPENPSHADTERVYWELLQCLQTDAGTEGSTTRRPRLRVVIDILSDTSASGINGICLANALAHNLSQEGLTRLWLEKSDIGLLWRGAPRVPLKLRMLWFAARLLLPWTVRSPLQGDAMRQWLLDAFDEMDRSQPAERASLMPDDHLLELFVPITDFHGYEREVPLDDAKIVYDRVHRHILEFRYHRAGLSRPRRRFRPSAQLRAGLRGAHDVVLPWRVPAGVAPRVHPAGCGATAGACSTDAAARAVRLALSRIWHPRTTPTSLYRPKGYVPETLRLRQRASFRPAVITSSLGCMSIVRDLDCQGKTTNSISTISP